MTTIYHNPKCSKSRATLDLITQAGIEPKIVLYLEQPPDAATLKSLTEMLDCSIADIIRSGEEIYKELGLGNQVLSEDEMIEIVVSYPKLLERPIVVNNCKAIIGRPPENVLNII